MKKIVINQDKKKDLVGFEEIYDLIDDKILDNNDSQGKITNDKLADNYDLYDFLDVEFKRLQKINDILTKKLDNLKNFPQTETLINEQKAHISSIKNELLDILEDPNNKIHEELSKLWKTALAYKQL